MRTSILRALAVACVWLTANVASAACVLGKMAELPVTMVGIRPIVDAQINGVDAHFVADSGAFYSIISPGADAILKLGHHPAPNGLFLQGIGGLVDVSLVDVNRFTVAGQTLTNLSFLVGGGEVGADATGVIGENILGLADAEYDLANGTIRLFRPKDCGSQALDYWNRDKPFSIVNLTPTGPLNRQIRGEAYVNGVRMRVVFDTGAVSILDLAAARRAGVNPIGADPEGIGYGFGKRLLPTWLVPVDSFKIGGEEIRHTKLRVEPLGMEGEDMIIGVDFFLSHHVYVANSQHRLYFTYNGGPVFDLVSGIASPPDAAPPGGTAKSGAESDEPTDAKGFARRGAALSARGDFEHAVVDLDRAIALAPADPKYYYERAMAHGGARQPFLAVADLNQALKLAPNDVQALVARARLRLAGRDLAGAEEDLAAASRIAPNEDDLRLTMAQLYDGADAFPYAIGQYDLWIAAHPVDSRQAIALNGRCWARAMIGAELDKALADCDAALKWDPKAWNIFESRGYVRIRRGDLDRAIADFNTAIVTNPKAATSLYGRGLAELRKGMAAQGKTDIAAAAALSPAAVQAVKRHGLTA